MRVAHPLSPRTSSMLRRLSALTATVTLALTIGSCSIGEDTQRLVVSSLNEQKADVANPKDSSGNMDNRPLSTASGVVTMNTSYVAGRIGFTSGGLTTTV